TSAPICFPAHPSCRFRSTHNSPSAVHRAVKGIPALFRVFPFKDDGNITHTATHKSKLSGRCWCCTFADDNIFFSTMCFFPGIIMMIMDFEFGLCAQNCKHLSHDMIPACVGISSGKLHCPVVKLSNLTIHIKQCRRLFHRLARGFSEHLPPFSRFKKPVTGRLPKPSLP